MKKVIIITLGLLASLPLLAQNATITESRQVMKTYPFSDPDPVANPSKTIYPYFRFDGFSMNAENKEWIVVTLENEYIKLTIFPEIGGKVWGAIDKKSGRQFIYSNDAVKFRNIAMRGPWTSGGIEFNFGIIGHAPTTATPVDYCTAKNDDGSVSCWISSYELITRTLWTVEVRLEKDKAYFTTHTTWFNCSAIDQPYYQWMNAGYHAYGNLEFAFPGTNYIGHAGDLHSYPVSEDGKEISWYEKNNFGGAKSYHVLGKYNDFYGAFYHDDKYGSVHVADYQAKLGMKIWIWGLSREGMIWEDLLTDNNGQYVELQSGRMYNQPAPGSSYTPFRSESFAPEETDSWTEYWFPVEDIGGICKASNIGAMNVAREGGRLKIAFSPVCRLSTTMSLYDGAKKVQDVALSCNPLDVWMKDFPNVPEGRLSVEIGDDLLTYSEIPEDSNLDRPKEIPSDFDWNSVYGLYVQGEQFMNQKDYSKAREYLAKCLEKDKYFLPALNAKASLQFKLGHYEDALSACRTALSLNAYDGKANYIYGLCCQALGKNTDAKDGFSVASRDPEFRTAAFEKLAEMYVLNKDYAKAEEYALSSLKYNSDNLLAKNILALVYRKEGLKDKASDVISSVLGSLPLVHGLRFENFLLGNCSETDFTSMFKNEMKREEYLELEEWYEQIGCIEEAEKLLEYVSDYPIANYRLAYLKHLSGDDVAAVSVLEKAQGGSPEFVFPFRPSTLKSLIWAKDVKPDWKNEYYEALIRWNCLDEAEALSLLKSCGDPDYAPFYLCRASLEEGDEKLSDLLKADKTQESWRTGYALMNYYSSHNLSAEAEKTGKALMSKYKDNYIIGIKYANVLCDNGKYHESLKILKGLKVLPNEGSSAGRTAYRKANLSLAVECLNKGSYKKALKCVDDSEIWSESLGVGKPYDDMIDMRLENYLRAEAYEGLNDEVKAQEYRNKVGNADPASFDQEGILSKLK
jgi:Tfp pilus assembly protein PilF